MGELSVEQIKKYKRGSKMMKNGKYAYYKGNEYKFSKDRNGNYIIITSDSKKTMIPLKINIIQEYLAK